MASDTKTGKTVTEIVIVMKNQTTTTPEAPASAPPPKSVTSMIGSIFIGIVRTIPTAVYGGTAAVSVGFYTDTFSSNEYGVVIADRFIEGAYFNVLAKVVFRFILPLISGWNPGPIYGAGLQGACLGYYFGSYGRRRCPFECCMLVGSVSMLVALIFSAAC